jgi:hypothetical protein
MIDKDHVYCSVLMDLPGEIRAFVTLPEGSDLGAVRMRGAGSAYVARFRGDRPIDLTSIGASADAVGGSESLHVAELPTVGGKPLHVYYSPRGAIVVRGRDRHLITSPIPFEGIGDVRRVLESGEFKLMAGFEMLPGDPVTELEPLPGGTPIELEPPPAPAGPEAGSKPEDAGKPLSVTYELGKCLGPPRHHVLVLSLHPVCPIHDRTVDLD